MKFNQPCLDCGRLSPATRCPEHQRAYNQRQAERYETAERKEKKRNLYNSQYRKQAKLIKAIATHCHLCGKPFTPNDQIDADHLFPELGNLSPLAPAHASCNRSRGNKPL